MKIVVEIKQTGTGLPPDDESGLSLNSTATWVRVGTDDDPGNWQASPWRPLLQTAKNLFEAIDRTLREG